MKVLVTGAAGFVGSTLCEALLLRGDDVVGVDAFVPYYARITKEANLRAVQALQAVAGSGSWRFEQLDLRHDDLSELVDGVKAVVHLAAMPGLARSWTDIDAYATHNVVGTAKLVDACRRAGVGRFVHVSTSSVYGIDAEGDEGSALQPASPYGITKLAAEQLVLANVRQFDFPAVVLRYFSIYGPRQRPDMGYHLFCEALLDDAPITVFGDGRQTRSNTYIDDCVAGTLAALDGARDGEVYNLGGGEIVSLIDAIEILACAAGVRPRLVWADPRPGDQRATRAVFDKATAHFGYRPRVGPADGLVRQLSWHRASRAASAA